MQKIGRYFSFTGRTSRLDYWRIQVPMTLFMGVCLCGGLFLAEGTGIGAFSALGVIALAPMAWMSIALLFRRLHDRNKSGWWILPFYIAPLILALAARAMLDKGGGLAAALVALAEVALWVWAFVDLGLLSGVRGENRYGPDPRASYSR